QWSSVQTLPSLVQAIVAGSKQLSAASLQVRAHSGPPAHGSPAWFVQPPAPSQVSGPLQNVPSLHDAPSGELGCVHVPAPSHTSLVHGFPSLAHGPVLLVWTQPPIWLQLSVVQGFPSLHAFGQTGPMKRP